jgi:F-type H+-transporting ATPase subunit alpha
MKLEYLQFLELEIFTRFGTRLERSVERHIARGRLLRTIFAQERLALCPIEFDMAWLTAFTEGWLDDVPLDRIPVRLAFLEQKVSEGGLTLADGDDRWRTAVRAWLHEAER